MANIELDGANKKIKVDSGDLTLDVPGDIILDADGADLVFADGGTNILKVTNSSSDVVFQPQVDAKDIIFKQYDGTTVATVEDNGTFNIPTDKLAINGTAVTATAAELNLIDGGTARGTTAIADGDGVLINDAGTMRMTNVTTLKTYIGGPDPSSADGDSLGTASLEWSDLYLADGGIVYFGNDQDIRLTHNADKGLILKHSATADDKPVILTLQTGETDMAQDDVIGKIEFQAPDEGTGTDAVLVSAAIQAVAEGDFSSSSNATRLEFMTGSSEAATSQMSISSGGIVGIGAVPTGDLGVGLHIKTADSGASVNAEADELVLENGTGAGNCGMSILSATDGLGGIYFADSGANKIGMIDYNHSINTMSFQTNSAEAMRIESDGDVLIAKTAVNSATVGHQLHAVGEVAHTRQANNVAIFNREDNGSGQNFDGQLISFRADNTEQGTIAISSSTTSYNAFSGAHWGRLADNTAPTILRGTVIESIATMIDWYRIKMTNGDGYEFHEEIALPDGKSVGDTISHTAEDGVTYNGVIEKQVNEQLPMTKISDTEDSKAVYGVFNSWDNEPDDGINDMLVTALGAFIVRVHKDETLAIGDLLSSKGDGTAKKQADDIFRASTIAKVTSTEKSYTYADGSYCVPCTLHCG